MYFGSSDSADLMTVRLAMFHEFKNLSLHSDENRSSDALPVYRWAVLQSLAIQTAQHGFPGFGEVVSNPFLA